MFILNINYFNQQQAYSDYNGKWSNGILEKEIRWEKCIGKAFFHSIFFPKDRSLPKVTINGNKYQRSYFNLSLLKLSIKTLKINSI